MHYDENYVLNISNPTAVTFIKDGFGVAVGSRGAHASIFILLDIFINIPDDPQ